MSLLTPEDCPNVAWNKVEKINALTDQQLMLEVEKGKDSSFGPKMQPVLKTALAKRKQSKQDEDRNTDIQLSKESNEIASRALEQARLANTKADQARFWSGLAVSVTVILAAIAYFK